MIRFLPGTTGQNQNNMRLTSVADKIKEVFRPGNIVRAKVAKNQGDKVILNLNNNLFQVKSQVPLTEGTWIKGQVYTDKSGTTYLQLLESQEDAELRAKTERFFQQQGSRLEDTQLNRELTKAVFSMGKQASPKLITDLASFFSSEGGSTARPPSEAQEVAFLFLNQIPVTDSTVNAARGLLQADISAELNSSSMGDLFLIPEGSAEPMKASIQNLFKLFLGNFSSTNITNTAETWDTSNISNTANTAGTSNISTTDSILNLLGISRAINAVNHDSPHPEPLFGFFLLQTGQDKTPGQFYISRFQRERKQAGYDKQKSPTELTLGISLNMEHLGPMVIRMHFMSGVLSLQLTAHSDSTKAQFDEHLQKLKQQLTSTGLTVARLETHRAHLEDPDYQRRLAKIPFTPDGNLDFKI